LKCGSVHWRDIWRAIMHSNLMLSLVGIGQIRNTWTVFD